jgi:threonine dehydratase
MDHPPDLRAIREAHARIRPYIHSTPVFTCATLDRLSGARLFFKCENFQKVGAFKARGACNAVFSLSWEAAVRGVVTHSSGNHAAALAMAAGRRGVPAHIVMPRNASRVKKEAVAAYGGRIVFCEPTLAAREEACARVMAETGARLVHPYNDYQVIAGQGTAALEFVEEVKDLELLVAPVGGGGLLSGSAIAAKALVPTLRVIGAEPAGADDAYRSFVSGELQPLGEPVTVADGLRTSLGTLTFPLIRAYVDEIVTASEEAIVAAMRKTWELMKIVIEPSSAVPLAALLEGRLRAAGRRVGIILSGGNVDLDRLPWQAG